MRPPSLAEVRLVQGPGRSAVAGFSRQDCNGNRTCGADRWAHPSGVDDPSELNRELVSARLDLADAAAALGEWPDGKAGRELLAAVVERLTDVIARLESDLGTASP